MATSYTAYNANVNSAAYRAEQRPTVATPAERIARLEQWLADRAGAEWTQGYKAAARELKMLKEAK